MAAATAGMASEMRLTGLPRTKSVLTSGVRSMPVKIQLSGGVNENFTVHLPSGSTLGDLKKHIALRHTDLRVTRMLYRGNVFRASDDGATLVEKGIFKEVVLQVHTEKIPEDEIIPDKESIFAEMSSVLTRRNTEDSIQFGDVILIHVSEARDLVKADARGSNAYCFLTFKRQVQSGSVRMGNQNPSWNETFGFFVDYLKTPSASLADAFITLSVYHNVPVGDDKSLGGVRLALRDIKRDVTQTHFCKLEGAGSGEVLISVSRHSLTSPMLRDTCLKIIEKQQPWTKALLDSFSVTLGSFLGTQPWSTVSDTGAVSNPALHTLNELLLKNEIDFGNIKNVRKVEKILKSQKLVLTDDGVCGTIHFSDVAVTERELYTLLQTAVPSGVKSIFYCQPVTTIDMVKSEHTSDQKVSGYVVIQFKSSVFAVRALLYMLFESVHFDAAFGPPKVPGERGLLGADTQSLIEGLMQVSTPKWRQKIEDARNGAPPSSGDKGGESLFSPSLDEVEAPYYWVKVTQDSVMGYRNMQDTDPEFILGMGEMDMRKAGAFSIDLFDSSSGMSREEFTLRSTNSKLLSLYYEIMTNVREGTVYHGLDVSKLNAAQRAKEPESWLSMACQLSKKTLPLSFLYSPDGHKWFANRVMLNSYVRKSMAKENMDQIVTRFTERDLADILQQSDFNHFAEMALKQSVLAVAEKAGTLMKCPDCGVQFEFDCSKLESLTPEEQLTLEKLRDADGNPMSAEAKEHYLYHRVRCPNPECAKDFCKSCLESPYHLGYTCESFKLKAEAKKCRFCDAMLSEENTFKPPLSRALACVCTKDECIAKMKSSCVKTLSCGHPCCGVHDEEECLPCLFCEADASDERKMKDSGDDFCTICYVESFKQAPTVLLECGHMFHYDCLRPRLEMGFQSVWISFDFATCPTCRSPINHPAFDDIIKPLREMEATVKQDALERLRYEDRHLDKEVTDPSSDFYQDEVGFAMHTYAFFQCYECKKPYFGGAKECKAQEDEDDPDSGKPDPKDLICNSCQKIESVDQCKEHGPQFLAFKCRYCCSMGVFHCWGKVHFCRECHQPSVWDKLSTYSTGRNKLGVESYQQCPDLKRQIDDVMTSRATEWASVGREEKDFMTFECRANPETCPLGVRHPPNGFEFGLGCTLCKDKDSEEENRRNRERLEREARSKLAALMGGFMSGIETGHKFVHRSPMDDNGILYFFGTKGKTTAYENPGKAGMVEVLTSQLMPDSEDCSALVGRRVVRCVTKPGASCWFSVDFVDKFVKPSNYTLRHYVSWDTECLRNWVIEGSLDGESWLVLRQHNNDTALNHKGQSYTWALHDYGCAFKRLRVKQTGPNNNNHYFLACSGFEVYGNLYKWESKAEIEAKFWRAYQEQQKMKALSLVRFWKMVEKGQQGVYHFTYDQDFDENGILYFLGTHGSQKDWENPASSDEVYVTLSSTVKDGAPPEAFVGRDTVRCVTKPEDNAWMQVDFKDRLIQPSYYSLRHYSSWDTECLRNWVLQASNDGIHWITVKKHEEDTALNEKGATYTWPVQGRGAYRIWRVKQTGLNSNKHKYLACSGIEFYGQLYLTKFDPLAHVSNRKECEATLARLKKVKICTFVEDNDKNGAVYWCGTRGGKASWVNPGARGWIKCEASSLMRDSTPASALCGRIAVRCVTQPLENSWFTVDFKNLYICPTHYSLRHYISWDTEALRNWVLEGSFNGFNWVTLRTHKDDPGLSHKGAVATWPLRSKGAMYRVFRIKQTGLNSNGHLYNSLSGFEVYGEVYQIAHPAPRVPPGASGVPGAEVGDDMDAALTGEVPWDTETASTTAGGPGTTTVGGIVDEEDQDMALLREFARQEKQRLIHHLSAGNGYPFHYRSDFDENGLVHFLATDWRTAPWRNPAETGMLTVTSSRLAKDSVPATAIVGTDVVRCVCMAEKNNWFMVDFRTLYLQPTHYTLRHYDSWPTECLRNWYLEGSNDLKKFKIIYQHKNDTSLWGKGSTHTWKIDSKGKRYRAFRIRQYDKNSNKHWYLACSGIEFYGEVYFRPK